VEIEQRARSEVRSRREGAQRVPTTETDAVTRIAS